MSESPERKAWNALAMEAAEFYLTHGDEHMSAGDRAIYEELMAEVERAAKAHNNARGSDGLSPG